jgi:hypothetical protein
MEVLGGCRNSSPCLDSASSLWHQACKGRTPSGLLALVEVMVVELHGLSVGGLPLALVAVASVVVVVA